MENILYADFVWSGKIRCFFFFFFVANLHVRLAKQIRVFFWFLQASAISSRRMLAYSVGRADCCVGRCVLTTSELATNLNRCLYKGLRQLWDVMFGNAIVRINCHLEICIYVWELGGCGRVYIEYNSGFGRLLLCRYCGASTTI